MLDRMALAESESPSHEVTRSGLTSTVPVALYTIDPLSDMRWDEFVATHPRASVFHHRGWLLALAATYAYQPAVVTSCLMLRSNPGELALTCNWRALPTPNTRLQSADGKQPDGCELQECDHQRDRAPLHNPSR